MSSRIRLVHLKNASQAVISQTAGRMAATGVNGQVAYFEHPLANEPVTIGANVSCLLVRDFLAADREDRLRRESELLYCVPNRRVIYRTNMARGKQLPMPPVFTCLGEIVKLATSHDGRYIAVGDTNGAVEVWCMDMYQPYRVSGYAPEGVGAVVGLAFKNSNVELYIAFSNGEYHRMETFRGIAERLSNDQYWACYEIATQRNGKAIVFGGDGRDVWMLQTPFTTDEYEPSQCPFGLQRVKTVSGGSFLQVAGMPFASVGRLRTGVRPFVRYALFLSDSELLLASDNRAELWNLERNEIMEECRFSQFRLIGAGAHENDGFLVLT